jgi:hypothetical protein
VLSSALGFGPLMRRTARAVARAYALAGRHPLLLIGHSSGGLLARLATSPQAYQGHLGGVAAAVGALVMLGTPHVVGEAARRSFRAGYHACRFLDATIPGACFAPRTGYLTVGSRCIAGAGPNDRDVRRRIAGALYALLGGREARTRWGDGLILEDATHLIGARNLTLEGFIHAPGLPVPWYDSEEGLDAWWEPAVEAWREAGWQRRGPAEDTR